MSNIRVDAGAPKFTERDLESTIPERFEQIAALFPDRLAVVHGRRSLTYEELNAASNRTMHILLQRAVTGSPPVAILMDNDLAIIGAMLGVLKAGAAYCVLDPFFTAMRNVFILDDLQSEIVLTDNANLAQANQLAGETRQIINVETLDWDCPSAQPVGDLTPESLAGIYYTSGTTGEPKGIERTHANLLHKCLMVEAHFPVHVGSVVSLLYSCYYGASTQDIYPTLLSGATLSILHASQTGPENLANWLIEQRVSHVHLHSSILRALLDYLTEDAFFPRLLYVQPSQRLYRRDVTRLWQHLPPQAMVIHRLASTETGTVTLMKLNRGDTFNSEVVPVGYPVPDVEVFVTDESGAQVEAGMNGEIVARGRFLPRRYWRRPKMSAEKFQVDPADSRYQIVKLGDIGRLRSNGCLELVGRLDHMVKIRGHPVELDEVLSRLEQLPTVHKAAVTVHPDAIGDPMLVAFVQPKGSMKVKISGLRSELEQDLAPAMIPSRFVLLDSLPTLPNGKVDRGKLPSFELVRPDLDTPYAAPRTPTEIAVAAVWADVLGLDQVGIDDNFLDLGGHSLAAGRIVSMILREFQVDLPISLLFESPTVADMALVITQQQAGKLDQDALERLLAELEEPVIRVQSDEE
jgi:acyl-CoA synthetase (AMP-forming)/AMP-acid ligase II/acyl carrier protein